MTMILGGSGPSQAMVATTAIRISVPTIAYSQKAGRTMNPCLPFMLPPHPVFASDASADGCATDSRFAWIADSLDQCEVRSVGLRPAAADSRDRKAAPVR